MLTPDQVAALQSNASAPQSFTGQKTKWVNGQLVLSNPPAEAKKKKGFWEDQISTGGGIGGALAGGAAGAAIGSVVPVIGTAIGGLAGAAIGGFAGGAGGQAIENKVTGSDDNIWKEGAMNSLFSLPPIRTAKLLASGGKILLKGGGERAVQETVKIANPAGFGRNILGLTAKEDAAKTLATRNNAIQEAEAATQYNRLAKENIEQLAAKRAQQGIPLGNNGGVLVKPGKTPSFASEGVEYKPVPNVPKMPKVPERYNSTAPLSTEITTEKMIPVSRGEAFRQSADEILNKPSKSLLGKFTTKAGEKLNQAGNDIAVKSLGLTKGQKNTLLSKTGEKASDIVGKYGIKTADDIPAAVKPLFDEYAATLTKIPGTISREQIESAFQKAYAPMLAKGVPTGQRAIGEKLKAEADNLLAGVSEGGVTAAELNGFKQAFDKLAYKLKASDPGAADINKLSRDALNNLLDDFTTQSGVQTSKGTLKDLGAEINKLASLDKLAKKNIEGAGGHTTLGLTPAIAGVGGAGVGGLPGAVASIVATKALNSSKGQGAMIDIAKKGSTLLSKFKDKTANPVGAGKIVKRLSAAGVVGGLPELSQSSIDAQNMSPAITSPANTDPSIANIPSLNTEMPQNATPDPMAGLDGAIQQALAAGDYKGLDALLRVADYYEKRGAPAAPKKITEAQAARQEAQMLTDQALGILGGGSVNTGMISGPLENIKAKFNLADPETYQFQTTSSSLKAAIAKARAGTSFTEGEKKLLETYTPNDNDSKQQLITKLQLLKQIYDSAAARDQGTEYLPTPVISQ